MVRSTRESYDPRTLEWIVEAIDYHGNIIESRRFKHSIKCFNDMDDYIINLLYPSLSDNPL